MSSRVSQRVCIIPPGTSKLERLRRECHSFEEDEKHRRQTAQERPCLLREDDFNDSGGDELRRCMGVPRHSRGSDLGSVSPIGCLFLARILLARTTPQQTMAAATAYVVDRRTDDNDDVPSPSPTRGDGEAIVFHQKPECHTYKVGARVSHLQGRKKQTCCGV